MAEKFGEKSGYLLNKTKTQIICSSKCQFQDPRVTETGMYLGVKITAGINKLWPKNIDPVLQTINNELRRINSLHLTIIGRINAIKMKIFPKILYLIRAISLELAATKIHRIEAMFSKFIWGYQKV